MLNKIEYFISILAGIIIAVLGIIKKASPTDLALKLVIVIIVFYIIGVFVKFYITKMIFKEAALNNNYEQANDLTDARETTIDGDDYDDTKNNE